MPGCMDYNHWQRICNDISYFRKQYGRTMSILHKQEFSIHADVNKAQTPPPKFYQSNDIYQQILDQVLIPSWQPLAPLDLPEPGSIMPTTLLPGSLDAALLISRDEQKATHCLSNVCTHRGAILCEKAIKCDEIRCPYHSRRFHMDGRMRYAPGFKQAKDFPDQNCDLPSLPLQQWGPLWFTSLRAGQSLQRCLQPMQDRVGWLPFDQFRYSAMHSRNYEFAGNWMLYVENYLDSLHIPFVHPELNTTLDFSRYRTELFPGGSLQLAIAADTEAAFELPAAAPDHGLRVAAWYFWLLPNLMFNFYPWGLSLNIVEPLGVNRTRVRFLSYIWREELLAAGAGAALHTVEMEDEAMVLSVTRGLRSALYQRGRYAPEHEAACHHFHRMLMRQP